MARETGPFFCSWKPCKRRSSTGIIGICPEDATAWAEILGQKENYVFWLYAAAYEQLLIRTWTDMH